MSLWWDNPATLRSQQLAFGKRRRRKTVTQADVLLQLLRAARAENRALQLPDIMRAGIAQFTARIFELRDRGFVIENEMEKDSEGRVLARYWLGFDPERDGAQQ